MIISSNSRGEAGVLFDFDNGWGMNVTPLSCGHSSYVIIPSEVRETIDLFAAYVASIAGAPEGQESGKHVTDLQLSAQMMLVSQRPRPINFMLGVRDEAPAPIKTAQAFRKDLN